MIEIKYEPSDILKRLDRFEKNLKQKGYQKALNAVASPIKRDMKSGVAVSKGYLRQGIGSRILNESQKARTGLDEDGTFLQVGVIKKSGGFWRGYIANYIEQGTDPHTIGQLNHPGISARPFIRPAFEQNESKIGDLFADALQKFINSNPI